jgi:hypothetical protein
MPHDPLTAARSTVRRATDQERSQEEQRTAGSAYRAAVLRTAALQRRRGISRFVFENGLVLAATALFLLSLVGQIATGHAHHNDEQRSHGQATLTLSQYLRSGAFIEATAENWESEFLQMAVFVVLTAYLFQRGSSESKRIEEPASVDQRPEEARNDPEAPWPVRRGGIPLAFYRHSLSLALFALFAMSFAMHLVGGAADYNEEQREHGEAEISTAAYLGKSRFWFESFQNWQSEFLSVAVLVLLTVWLREQGSPQSKPVAAPHDETGE